MKKFMLQINAAILALVVGASYCGGASAHGLPQTVHGGLLATELDLGFELFVRQNRLVVYVTDHDSPFDTKIFDGNIDIGNAVYALEPSTGGELISGPLKAAVKVKRAKLTLHAKVLKNPINVEFSNVPKR